MHIKFYNCSDDERRLTKTFTNEYDCEGTLRDQANIYNPEIALTTDVTGYQMCCIPEFGNKYYFIREVVQYRKNIWKVTLEEDVLSTYKDKILELSGLVSQLAELGYTDGSKVVDVRETVEKIKFDDELKLGSHILVAKGGD